MKRAADTIMHHTKRPNAGHGPSLMWFRSDLRAHDNPALSAAAEYSGTEGGLHCLFLVDSAEWRRHDMSASRVDFMLRNVKELRSLLKEDYNVPLHVLRKDADSSTVASQIGAFCQQHSIHNVFFNVEYEVDESKRDAEVMQYLQKQLDISCITFHDQCVVKPGTLRTKTGQTPFCVFTPFKKAWIEELQRSPYQLSEMTTRQTVNSGDATGDIPDVFDLPEYSEERQDRADMIAHCRKHWPAGERAAMARLEQFCQERLATYKDERDFPHHDRTSRLSAYLSLGVVSARQCLDRALRANQMRYDHGVEGAVHWISEVCWREFYRHIMVDFPRVSKGRPFKTDTDKVPWRRPDQDPDAKADFKAWCQGRTGYPLVDAAMRCLQQTGWMHNRLRMLTAMFLTKDLLIWWPEGERHFMRFLIDGDLASNNGGWQWSASTGTDSQPYFRIFNPVMQSEKFDAQGHFIRQWVPELQDVSAKDIHEPYKRLSRAAFEKLHYPPPIVDHYEARDRCLAAFKSIK